MKKINLILLCLLSLFILSCKEDDIEKIDFSINLEENVIAVGEEKNLTITTDNNITLEDLEITYSKDNIVIIENGLIKGLNEGDVAITFTYEGIEKISKTLYVSVYMEIKEVKLILEDNLLYISKGNKRNYKIEVDPEIKISDINILSSDENIIKVEDGYIEALNTGSCKIYCADKNNKIYDEIYLEVVDVKISIEDVEAYLRKLYDNLEVSSDINFVGRYYDTDIYFEYSTNNNEYLSDKGIFKEPIVDTNVNLMIIYTVLEEEWITDCTLVIKGWGTQFDYAKEYLKDKVPTESKKTITLPSEFYKNNAKFTWYVDDVLLEDNSYSFERNDEEDYYITLKAIITIDGETEEITYSIRCIMKDSMNKVESVYEEIKTELENNEIVDDIILPTSSDRYKVNIEWRSYNPYVLDESGNVNIPLYDQRVDLLLSITMGEFELHKLISVNVKGKNKTEMWDKVEAFLNIIHKDTISTHSFYLYGYETGYEAVLTKNIGYIPFYTSDELKVTEDILPDNSPLKPNRTRTSTKYITLHNSGMAHPSATAKGLNEYIHTTDREASWHFSVDDYEAYQELKLDEVGWHSGDGSYTYGDIYYNNDYKRWCIGGGNNNSVGIEMCVYSGCDFNMVMRNTAKLVAKLLVKYNLTTSDIRQHYDFAGKDCPQVLRQANRWKEMLELINIEYYAITELKGVVFKFESLTQEYLDNSGKIINNPNTNPTIKYKVSVTYGNETKEYIYESKLDKIK